jgi:CheY-like chemotaxis protein
MPGRSGPQLSTAVAVACPDIKVLFTSGYGRDALEQYGVLAAGDNLLAKPSSTPELLHQVRDALDS